jgi:hypothetical protein
MGTGGMIREERQQGLIYISNYIYESVAGGKFEKKPYSQSPSTLNLDLPHQIYQLSVQIVRVDNYISYLVLISSLTQRNISLSRISKTKKSGDSFVKLTGTKSVSCMMEHANTISSVGGHFEQQ